MQDTPALPNQSPLAPGSAVIPGGQTQVDVGVDVLDGVVRERDETFVLRLTGSTNSPPSSDPVAMATIEAND